MSSFLTNFKVQGTFLMRTVAGLNLPLIRYSEPLCHYCLFRSCRRNVLTTCVFLFLWFCFFPLHLGRESGVYRVPCWFWILEEGTQTETELNCPPWFLSRWLQSCRNNNTTTSRMQQDPDDRSSDSGFFFHAPCDLKERRVAWWSLLLQEQDPEDLRCDFRLCSMLPVIWRKGESCSIVVPRTGSGRYFAGVISDFVQFSLWSEGKERSGPSLLQEQVREDIRRCDSRLCEMLPMIWRKVENWMIAVARRGSGV